MNDSNSDLAIKLMETLRKLRHVKVHNEDECKLTSGQMFMLHLIYSKNKSLEKPLTVSQISSVTTNSLSATTQIVSYLDKIGYTKREIDNDDRRIIRVTLTKKGEEYLIKHRNSILDYVKKIIETIGRDETIVFIGIMEKIISINMEDNIKND